MYFVFRNHTVERFFSKEYLFSGYDDISTIPQDAEGYVWWYQLPIKYDNQLLAEEVKYYFNKISYVLSKVARTKLVVALTLTDKNNTRVTEDDTLVRSAIEEYNSSVYSLISIYPNLRILDYADFCNRYSACELVDMKFYFMSKMLLNPKLNKDFQTWFSRKMNGIRLKRKKCLVLDLDNTLWGGILGEDGIDGIRIGGDYPGKAFSYWQEALLQLSKSGIILAVCSKNNLQDVEEAWAKNPYLVLRKEHFAAYRINWKDKVTNIKELSEDLNIGLDSMVFVDDNPSEQELVRNALPMVEVPEFPTKPYELSQFYNDLLDKYFKVYSLTIEDKKKTEQYKANIERKALQATFVDMEAFLESLNLQLTIERANNFSLSRIAQMTQKTNQFNLTTIRYQEQDIAKCLEEGWKIWCLSVADKFGDNGITGAIMINGSEIDSLLLSCRILGKGIEFAFVKTVLAELLSQGVTQVSARYLPTVKNMQVMDFYERCGFICTEKREDGSKYYTIDLQKADLTIKDYYNIQK